MEYFGKQVIQDRVKNFFIHSLQSDRLAHAYIFYGNEGRGKEAFAFELAKFLNCSSDEQKPCGACPSCIKINHLNHPDIKFVFATARQLTSDQRSQIIKAKADNPFSPISIVGHKNIAIEAIRELKNEAKYAAYEAKKRVFIISGAEYFSREAANSFLKLLEEPPDNLLILLITDDQQALLDTIRSRCQPIYFPEFSDDQIEGLVKKYSKVDTDIKPLIRISQNNTKKVFSMLNSAYLEQREIIYHFLKAIAADNMLSVSQSIDKMTSKRDKNYVQELLNLMILWLRDALHFQIMQDTQDFINIDYSEAIAKFAAFFKNSNMEKLIELVETAHFNIQRNAHPALTLTNLAIEMKNHLVTESLMREAI